MNDYSPEVYALIEGTHPSGYSIFNHAAGRYKDMWAVVYRGQVVRDGRTLEQAMEDVARYERLTAGLS